MVETNKSAASDKLAAAGTSSTSSTSSTSHNVAPSHLEQFSNLLEDGLLLVDFDQQIQFANAPASKLLGQELVNRALTSALPDVRFDDVFNNIKTRKRPHEFLYSYQKKLYRQFRIKLMPMGDDYVGVLIMDMTLQRNLDKVRRDFVANVSHELRSPLTSLIGFVETMQAEEALDKEDQNRFLSIMDEEAKRMTRLIDDLISLSRVEVEEHILPNEHVRLDEVIASVIDILTDRADKQKMRLTFQNHVASGDSSGASSGDKGVIIQGEVDEIVEVFHNLIENAIKYGFADSVINVSLSVENNKAVAVVTNQGDGIEERHIPRLTERFYRVDKARSRQKGGTGLGLAIVKHIVNRHRGDMTITSELGKTTCFAITLPLLALK